MKTVILFIFSLLFATSAYTQKAEITTAINNWHKAAAEADFETYFELMTTDGVFVGSDASEVWGYQEFKTFSKPYFDAGKAWTFEPVSRNIYLSEDKQMAWFDEVLKSEHMGVCRGSGVMVLNESGNWNVQHFVLSLAVPNALVDDLVKQKSELDQQYLKTQP